MARVQVLCRECGQGSYRPQVCREQETCAATGKSIFRNYEPSVPRQDNPSPLMGVAALRVVAMLINKLGGRTTLTVDDWTSAEADDTVTILLDKASNTYYLSLEKKGETRVLHSVRPGAGGGPSPPRPPGATEG